MKKLLALILFCAGIVSAQTETYHIIEADSGAVFGKSTNKTRIWLTRKDTVTRDLVITMPEKAGRMLTDSATINGKNISVGSLRTSAINAADYDDSWVDYIWAKVHYDSVMVTQIGQRVDILAAATMDSSGVTGLWNMSNAKITDEAFWRHYDDSVNTNILVGKLNFETNARMADSARTNLALAHADQTFQSEVTMRDGQYVNIQSSIASHTSALLAQDGRITSANTLISQESINRLAGDGALSSRIDLEASSRTSDYNTANAAITLETGNRTSADGALTASINLKASTTALNAVTGMVTTLQSDVLIQAGLIASKVSSGDVYSLIRQTVDTIKLQAANIVVNGTTTFSQALDNTKNTAKAEAGVISLAQSNKAYDDAVAEAYHSATVLAGNAAQDAKIYSTQYAYDIAVGKMNAALELSMQKIQYIDPTTTKIKGGEIQTGSVTALQIDVASLTAAKIVAGSVDAVWLNAQSIDASRITVGTLSADRITGGAISTGNLQLSNGSLFVYTPGWSGYATLTGGGLFLQGGYSFDVTSYNKWNKAPTAWGSPSSVYYDAGPFTLQYRTLTIDGVPVQVLTRN